MELRRASFLRVIGFSRAGGVVGGVDKVVGVGVEDDDAEEDCFAAVDQVLRLVVGWSLLYVSEPSQ
jgi:hypothetical protein